LESLPEFIAANHDNYLTYRKHLSNLPGVRMMTFDGQAESNYQYIILEIDEAQAGLSRDQLVAVLKAENVAAKRYFFPGCHRMPAYASQPQNQNLRLPVTERLAEQALALPTGSSVTSGDAATIAEIIHTALARASDVRRALTGAYKGNSIAVPVLNWAHTVLSGAMACGVTNAAY
jgi:dTDP-4-amino-4,6-dideoxygalactose transaminase